MFTNELKRAIAVAPRITLPAVTALMWMAFGDGRVSEAEAEVLSELIEAWQLIERPTGLSERPIGALRKPVGSRPRTDASMARRRRWAASGRLLSGFLRL